MRNLFFGLVVVLFSASCDSENDPVNIEQPADDIFCIQVYDPVCGSDGKTYSNSCEAERAGVEYSEGVCSEKAIGTVFFSGPIAADGCDWLIRIEGTDFSPLNLPDDFRADDRRVEIVYKRTGKLLACGLQRTGPEKIEISDIRFI